MNYFYFLRKFFLLFVVNLSFLFLSNNLLIANDTTSYYLTTMFIGHIVTPNSIDTVIGCAGKDRVFYPKMIKWGKDTTNNSYPDSLKVSSSKFVYPNWKNLRITCNITTFDYDTIPDMLFIISGRIQLDSITFKDTVKTIVLFGQKGLDTIKIINLSTVDTIQYGPYIAVKLKNGTDLTNCKLRDLSGIPSYQLNKITKPEFEMPMKVEDKNRKQPTVFAYPNPASNFVNLEIRNIDSGEYSLKITALSGTIVYDHKFIIAEDTFKLLDIQNLATGVYYLTLASSNSVYKTIPLIILH